MSARLAWAKRKSEVIHWYGMFQPTAPYLRRSWTTAWKKERPKSSLWYGSGLEHFSKSAFSSSSYERIMFALSPLGGSCVSLSDCCSTATGKTAVGIVVSHSR